MHGIDKSLSLLVGVRG